MPTARCRRCGAPSELAGDPESELAGAEQNHVLAGGGDRAGHVQDGGAYPRDAVKLDRHRPPGYDLTGRDCEVVTTGAELLVAEFVALERYPVAANTPQLGPSPGPACEPSAEPIATPTSPGHARAQKAGCCNRCSRQRVAGRHPQDAGRNLPGEHRPTPRGMQARSRVAGLSARSAQARAWTLPTDARCCCAACRFGCREQ